MGMEYPSMTHIGAEILPEFDGPYDVIEVDYDPGDFGQDECGVAAISLTEPSTALPHMIYGGLYEVQHRGQQSAGIAVADSSGRIHEIRNPGLVPQALPTSDLYRLPTSRYGTGHVRYGTVPGLADDYETAQRAAMPAVSETAAGTVIALSLNGNITNSDELGAKFRVDPDTCVTDGFLVTDCIAAAHTRGAELSDTVAEVLQHAEGAFSITVIGEDQLIGIRDPYGFRPLMYGTFEDDLRGSAFSSESHAFDAMGAAFRREVQRGEMVVCRDGDQVESSFPFGKRPDKLCAMELVYLYGPHGELKGRSVYMVRREMGKILADEEPVDADIVIGVPHSGIPAGEGFAARSGISYTQGVLSNRYSGRTFITPDDSPDQAVRQNAVSKKLTVIMPVVHGRRVVIVDDSIVRGNTTKRLVKALDRKGAAEIHVRSSSPRIKHPCYYGIAMPTPEELLANRFKMKGILKYLEKATSVGYLSIEGLGEATNATGKLCLACMDGNYPTPVPYPELRN